MKKVTTSGATTVEYDPNICPIRHVLAEIGDKWTILVITALKAKALRFSELKRAIPDISQRMLTQTLRKLERDGFVLREATPTIPPRVDYELSPLGRTLCDQLAPLAEWALQMREDVAKARAIYDAAKD